MKEDDMANETDVQDELEHCFSFPRDSKCLLEQKFTEGSA
jgi:hypothetical protein